MEPLAGTATRGAQCEFDVLTRSEFVEQAFLLQDRRNARTQRARWTLRDGLAKTIERALRSRQRFAWITQPSAQSHEARLAAAAAVMLVLNFVVWLNASKHQQNDTFQQFSETYFGSQLNY
jgi:hypothetical protein